MAMFTFTKDKKSYVSSNAPTAIQHWLSNYDLGPAWCNWCMHCGMHCGNLHPELDWRLQFALVFKEGEVVVVMVMIVLLVEVVMVVVVEGELLAICIGFRRRRSILPCRLGQAKAVKQTFTSLSHFHFRRLSNYSTFRSRCVGNTLVVSLVEKRGGGNICDHKLQTPESSGKSASAQPRLSSMRSHLADGHFCCFLERRKTRHV